MEWTNSRRGFRLHASALVDDEDSSPADVGHQRGTFESDSDPTGLLWLADGARPEGFGGCGDTCSAEDGPGRLVSFSPGHLPIRSVVLLQLILGDEKRIALAVAEAIEDRGAETLILTDPLDERLRLAPILAQKAPLRHDQSVFGARLQQVFRRFRRVQLLLVRDGRRSGRRRPRSSPVVMPVLSELLSRRRIEQTADEQDDGHE